MQPLEEKLKRMTGKKEGMKGMINPVTVMNRLLEFMIELRISRKRMVTILTEGKNACKHFFSSVFTKHLLQERTVKSL